MLSVTPSFVASMEQGESKLGRELRKMKDDVERPLAAILSLNTIAHTVGAAGAGAEAAAYFGDTYVGIISGVLTLLILIISEIIPKTLGAVYWRQLTPTVVRLLTPIIWLMWPLVKLAQGLTHLLTRGQEKVLVSREEFKALAELGEREGVFEADESRMLKNLFRFGSIRAKDIMTPRTVLFALPESMTVGEVMQEQHEFRFSRIPVYGKDRDDITGYILKSDLLLSAAQDDDSRRLKDLKRNLLVVSDGTPLPDLFENLMNHREHVGLIVDEYGGTTGLVTLEDLLETLLGMEIVDEADSEDDMQELARAQWRKRAQNLGLLTDTPEEQEAFIRLGLKGKPPPPSPDA